MTSLGGPISTAASASSKYQIVARLGRGGMAQVFLAVARGLGGFNKLLVIKRLESDEPAFRRMFLDEARVAALLSHPNVVHTYEVFEHGGSYFIAMEHLDGQPLNKIVRLGHEVGHLLDPRLCARIVADALAGLHYAHELRDYSGKPLNIVHRDVSPHNLFVTHDGQVKVFDFGVAKAESRLEGTDVGVLKGKLGYMAPEQAAGAEVDRRADIYSAGVVLWELLALEPMVTRESSHAALREVLRGSPRPLPDLPDVDEELRGIVTRALERTPARRFQTAQEMRDALLGYLASHPFTHEDLAQFMGEHFEGVRIQLQERIQKAIFPAIPQDPIINVSEAEGSDEAAMLLGLPDDQLPLLESGSFSVPGEADATRSLSPVPPVSSSAPLGPSTLPAPSTPEPPRPRRVFAFAAIGVALVVLGGWIVSRRSAGVAIEPPTALPGRAAPVSAQVVLRLHGSNTIGSELGPALAEAYLLSKGRDDVRRDPGKATESVVVSARVPADGTREAIEIVAQGSATAFADLAKHECDIGMASRAIKPAEAATLAQAGLGDVQSPAGEHVLGLDGIAIIVHPNNPIRTLDLDQLKRLFTGNVPSYAALGGAQTPVNVYARDDKSGTYDTFKHLVLGEDSLTPSAKRFADSVALSDAVTGDAQAVGFIGITYVRGAKALAVAEPGSTPLYPSAFTVATEDYPLSRRLYLYSPVQNASPTALSFVTFALSPEGQKVVRATGFVDLSVTSIEPRACDTRCAPRYAALTKNAQRLSVDFRFLSGRAELDSRALRDLDRLVTFLRQTPNAKLMLLGFSDARGSYAQNLALSHERAKKVADELASRGVFAHTVDSLGQEMPVASNANESGREKNRRVEAWLR